MKLSIVSTLYQSAPYVNEFHKRATAAAQLFAGDDYEILLVNDGSPDNSLQLAMQLADADPHVVAIDLSRNFGHHKAMMTGLAHAKGNHVFLIDSDLEEAPEWLGAFAEQMQKQECDVVYGVQAKRKGGVFERASGWLFYRAFRLLTGVAQVNNISTARLMTRRYVAALVAHQERELNIGGLWITTGFKQSPQLVTKSASSPTTYSFSRKLGHLVNAITSFSSLPLVFIFYAGLITFLSAAGFVAWLVFRYFFISIPPDGYTSIIASVWLFSGAIILFLGVLGIYLSKVFIEVKQRPYTIVSNVYQRSRGYEQ